MKKIIIAFMLLISVAQAQETHLIFQSELYFYRNNDWVLQDKNEDVRIPIVFENGFINIQAKKVTIIKVDQNTKKYQSYKSLHVYTFTGFNYIDNKLCVVSYMYPKDNLSLMVLSIAYEDEDLGQINFRYYMTLNK